MNDLDWEDRERVLRLLFSKMNAGVPASNWRAFARPPQQMERDSEEMEPSENQDDYRDGEGQMQALQHWTAGNEQEF